MKLSIPTLGEQQQQAQTSDLVPLSNIRRQTGRGQLVKGLQLVDVAGEVLGVAGADGEEGALLIGFSGEGEDFGGCCWGRGERL